MKFQIKIIELGIDDPGTYIGYTNVSGVLRDAINAAHDFNEVIPCHIDHFVLILTKLEESYDSEAITHPSITVSTTAELLHVIQDVTDRYNDAASYYADLLPTKTMLKIMEAELHGPDVWAIHSS